MVYSTCSMSVKQNEQVVQKVISQINQNSDLKYRLELVPVLGSPDLESQLGSFGLCDSDVEHCKRIRPGPESASAMFIAKLRKVARSQTIDAEQKLS